MGPRSRFQGQQRGLTLIELVIVIAVLGVMLALIIPRLGEIGDANLKQSARHLTGMIRFLRDESEATKKVLRLRFDVTGGRYWVEERAAPANTGEKPASDFKRYSSVMGTEGTLTGQTTFRDVKVASHPDEPYIQFTPDGWVEQAMIHLRNGDNKDFTLKVKPLTGDTELLDGYVEEG